MTRGREPARVIENEDVTGSAHAVARIGGEWISFGEPAAVIVARHAEEVGDRLRKVEELARASRCYAVGFVTYEAAAAFGLTVFPAEDGLPLVWFGLFSAPNRDTGTPFRHTGYKLTGRRPTVAPSRFTRVVEDVKRRLEAGDTYQANYTFALEAGFEGDARGLFADLVEAQQGDYAVYLRCGRFTVCSASPELFFERKGDGLTTRPMKGTAPRGRTLEEDRAQSAALRNSAKEQAENVMIVDMIRNDLGRIAKTGTVRVADLFTVERYPNVWQMTSTVTAESTARLDEIFAAMHPSASVTGAPKVRTMELLRQWEHGPRGVYTGAVGYVTPDGDARFNVAIRTAVVDHQRGRVRFGVGSGIVWDSQPDQEYAECLAKGAVFGARARSFELLETLSWSSAEGFVLLDRHLDRLRTSAEHFGYGYDEAAIRSVLNEAVRNATEALRVRLLVARNGSAHVETATFQPSATPARVVLAESPVETDDVFLYHKTSNREVYDRARVPGYDDTLLWNARGEITEFTTGNVVVALNGRRLTPPVGCGLLAGTFRAELLARGEVEEAIIPTNALREATHVWLINSVQGWRAATVELGNRETELGSR